MSDPTPERSIDAARTVLEDLLRDDPRALGDDIAAPVEISGSTTRPDGSLELEVRARRLVAVTPGTDDPLHVAVPLTGRIELDASGGIRRIDLGALDRDAEAEARAWARSLLDEGQLPVVEGGAGAETGPASAVTSHAIVRDARGRRIIERRGFTGAGRPRALHGPPPAG
jgi:hypothetical protein